MSEQERVARGSQIIDGYGDDSTFDRLQGWVVKKGTRIPQMQVQSP